MNNAVEDTWMLILIAFGAQGPVAEFFRDHTTLAQILFLNSNIIIKKWKD